MKENTAKVYNINVMRPAFIRMRQMGNRGTINKKVCEDLGISNTYFEWYQNSIKKLFEVVSAYCRLKNSPTAKIEDVNAALDKIYTEWKNMLSTAERSKEERELHATEHDISNLVGFCQMFIDDKNDLSRGVSKDFCAEKVWAVQTMKKFQKFVETDLGIRIAQVEVISDEERDFLRAERKIMSKWKKAEKRIEEIKVEQEEIKAGKAKYKTKEMHDMLDKRSEELEKQLKTLNEKIEGFQKAHYALLHPEEQEDKKENGKVSDAETKVVPPAPVAAAEPKTKSRKGKKNKKDSKAEEVVLKKEEVTE